MARDLLAGPLADALSWYELLKFTAGLLFMSPNKYTISCGSVFDCYGV